MARLSRQSESQPDVSFRRTLFVAAFVAFWMLGIGARLVYLQVSKHDDLVARAHKQQQEPRGLIEVFRIPHLQTPQHHLWDITLSIMLLRLTRRCHDRANVPPRPITER